MKDLLAPLLLLLGLWGSVARGLDGSPTEDVWAEVKVLKNLVEELRAELMVTQGKMEQLQAENTEKPKVAFSTALTDSGTVGRYETDTVLKFSKVFTNIGKAYDPSTGVFTAPVKGAYYFQFTMFLYKSGYIAIKMFKNDQQLLYNREYKAQVDYDYSTNSLILELNAGDQIYLLLPRNYIMYDDSNNHSTFSGSLLFVL